MTAVGISVTAVGCEQNAKQPELKKHAATIHCSNTLSLLQRKITNALLYHAYHDLMFKEEYEITIKQLCRLIAYNGNNHAAIKNALRELLSTVIEWNVVNDVTGEEDWTASSILASVSLQGPRCLYAYSPRMKALLHSPSMFGKINLFIQSRFKSSYGLALYENCVRYRGLPYTKWFELEVFRKLMGVPPDTYPIFRDLKRRILDKAVEEVNTYSDLIIDPELYREGRKVLKVRFLLKERAKKTRLGSVTSGNKSGVQPLSIVAKDPLITQLISEMGLSATQAEAVLQDYSREFIAEKIQVVKASKNFRLGKVNNLAAYFLSALKNNYQDARGSADFAREKQLHMAEQENDCKKLQDQVTAIRHEYAEYREQVIDAALKKLSAEEYENFIHHFKQHLETNMQSIFRLQCKKYGAENFLQSPSIQALLRTFAIQELTTLRENLLSIENFVSGLSETKYQAWKKFHELEM